MPKPGEEEQDVNPPAANPSPADPESVNEETEAQEAVEETTPQENEQGQDAPAAPPQVNEDVDERGIPWKNRAIEAERKSQEIPQLIRQTVEEVTRANAQPKKEEYNREHIPALKKYAADNPQYADWVETQIEDIRGREVANIVKKELGDMKQQQTNEMTRQQSEAWVLNHPKFKDCFVGQEGAKQWNYQNPLTAVIGRYLNQIDPVTGKAVKDRPDGLAVAARMAYADHVLNTEPAQTGKVNQLKKELRKTQKTQITPSVGAPTSAAPKSKVRGHLDEYGRTYNPKKVQDATKAFLVASGILKEE